MGRLWPPGVAADAASGLQAVEVGHLHVHEHEVHGLALNGLNGAEAVLGEEHAVAFAFEDGAEEGLGGRPVLGHEDGGGAGGGLRDHF